MTEARTGLLSSLKSLWGRKSGSLRGRLIRLAAIWYIVSLAIIAVVLIQDFSFASIKRFESGIDVLLKELVSGTRFDDSGEIERPPQYDPRLSSPYSGLYWEVYELDAKGQVSHKDRSLSLLSRDLSLPANIDKTGEPSHYNGQGPINQPLRQVAQYLIYKDHNLLYVIAEDSEKVNGDIETFAVITISALLVMALGSLLAIYVQVRYGLKPLDDLRAEIGRVRDGQQARLIGQYPQEILPVALQLNAYLDYNHEVLERQRTHVGNLAHALKTPLSVLMTQANGQDELALQVKKQNEVMNANIDRHLRRARAAARAHNDGQSTPVEAVIDELAVTLEQVFQSKSVMIDWRCEDGLCFQGEVQDLQEMLGNLMENACKWCQKRIFISANSLDDDKVCLSIEDDGAGLNPDQYNEVIKRGERLDENAPGSGLGLSIVDELARAYQGSMTLGRADLGGLKISLILPKAASEIHLGEN